MAKNVNARFAQKNDSLENWKKATGFVPFEGEFFLVNDRDCPISIGDGQTPASTLSNKALFDKVSEERLAAEFSNGKFYVSGVWVFKEEIVANSDISSNLVFTSNGETFSKIYLDRGSFSMYYDNIGVLSSDGEIFNWTDDAYRTVDFGTEPQEVSEEFYLWLKDSAVKQETKVSGKWYFNEVPEADLGNETSIIQYLNYKWKSNDFGELIGINLQIGLGGISAEDNNDIYDIYLENEWYGERLIDFGAAPQTVSADFYNWLTQNAICLESANQLLDIEGLKIYDAMLRGIIDKKAENVEATTTVAGLMPAADKAKLDTLTETQLQKLLALIVDDNELNTMLEEVLV